MAYVLLSGTMPFSEEDNVRLFEQIKNCDWSFKGDCWKKVSKEAMNFVSQLLVKEPEKRINCT